MDYTEFLKSKNKRIGNFGKSIDKKIIHERLFDYQKDVVQWAVKKGRCAIFLDTGLGKTNIQLEYARILNEKTLIIAPLSVARQTVREAKKIDIEVKYIRNKEELNTHKVNITNYELIDNFDINEFGCIILDECFPPDTLIDCVGLDRKPGRKYIKDIRRNDKIYNAYGVDNVYEVHKRRINRAYEIHTGRGDFTSSENHPFFTMHGWKLARDIQPGDYLMETSTAMRLLRKDIFPEMCIGEKEEILQSILFSEMENDATGNNCKSTYERSTCENREKEIAMVQGWIAYGNQGVGKNQKFESIIKSRNEKENIVDVASDELETFRAWGKWSPDDIAAAINEGCTIRNMDTGICYIIGPEKTRISDKLQSRLRKSQNKNRNRNRRILPRFKKAFGCKERQYAGFIRVESIEIYEQGNPKLDCYREADGFIYFYDIKAERHPSFSINGCLVHNSSILKSIGGVYKRKLIDACKNIKYRMACTATPAPNDNTEIGNHAEFLGICTHAEMLAQFFINANKEHTIEDSAGELYWKKGTNRGGVEWRLKHHAEDKFFEWLSEWAICFTDPGELGYKYNYKLPELNIEKHIIAVKEYKVENGELFFTGLKGITDRINVKRATVTEKLEKLKELMHDTIKDEQCIIWCNLAEESRQIKNAIDCVEVNGEDDTEYKAKMFEDFQDGKFNTLLTKQKIGGFGMNFFNAHNMVYFGLSDSWEMFYQSIRREWRYGQKYPVNVYIILTQYEMEIYQNVMRKDLQAKRLKQGLIERIKKYEEGELQMHEVEAEDSIERVVTEGKNFKAIRGDSCIELKNIESNSIDMSVYSPPFVDLFTYSNTEHDLGNCRNAKEFYEHYTFIAKELLRVIKPGRLCCVHTSDIPAMAQRDGYIGLKDFPGDMIRLHMELGWTFVGRAFVGKNPQSQAVRTKSKALLFVQLRKDSSDSRPALIDQVLIFKKPGENAIEIKPVENGEMDNEIWIDWAHGIWNDISESDTLRYSDARAADDEKHICPLQLGTIERCIKLYSNPGETILSPFMGIGSEIYQAIRFGRKGIGIELKESYYKTAVNNLKYAEGHFTAQELFDEIGAEK
jgi:superfamily II DNA or RNA helicase